MTISIENLIDFQYINSLLLKNMQNTFFKPYRYQPSIVLQIIIDDKAYDFKFCSDEENGFKACNNAGLNWLKLKKMTNLSFGKLGSGLRKANFYLMLDKSYTVKHKNKYGSYSYYTYSKGETTTPSKFKKDFIQHLKSGNSLYFKIISVSLNDSFGGVKEKFGGSDFLMKSENSDYDNWFNTYYVDLKGSSKALSF